MINGQMSEAKQGVAVLEDVDEGTIERFIEWAYKGFYTEGEFELNTGAHLSLNLFTEEEPEMNGRTPKRSVDSLAGEEDIDERSFWQAKSGSKRKPDKKRMKTTSGEEPKESFLSYPEESFLSRPKESFLHRQYTVRKEVITIPPTRANRGADEDYTKVFLSHARLYVFAEKYDITQLKSLALEELHHRLAIYTLYPQRTGDIVALLRYVYANTSAPTSGVEDIRSMLGGYIGKELSMLIKDGDFKDLMIEDKGALLGDFLKMVAKRIN